MGSARVGLGGVRAPRGWLGLAFLGVWLYFLSQLLQFYREAFAAAAGISVPDATDVLRLTSNLGQIVFLAGVGAALWRANLAAGLSSSGVSGLVIASAGVGVLVLFEVVLFLAWFGLTGPIAALGDAYAVGSIMGVALGLGGIAYLGVGLSQAVGLFGRREDEAAPRTPEKMN